MQEGKTRGLVDEAIDELAASLERGESATLRAYLAVMGRFRRYSLGNQLLIAMARPQATQVAGFYTWRKLGRSVRSGEKGIHILAPIVSRRKRTGTSTVAAQAGAQEQADAIPSKGTDVDERSVVGFRGAVVFDVAQTEGKELPAFAEVGGEVGEFLPRLLAWADDQGIGVTFTNSLGAAQGMASGGQIWLRSDLRPGETFSTLVHEIAHVRLHHIGSRDASRTVRETEAEAVAFVVCHTVGLECGSASSDYIQLYQGDRKLLMASLDRIRATAMEILAAIEDASKVGTTATPSVVTPPITPSAGHAAA